MREHPIRLDPTASFDVKVARLGDEHNPDVSSVWSREDRPISGN